MCSTRRPCENVSVVVGRIRAVQHVFYLIEKQEAGLCRCLLIGIHGFCDLELLFLDKAWCTLNGYVNRITAIGFQVFSMRSVIFLCIATGVRSAVRILGAIGVNVFQRNSK